MDINKLIEKRTELNGLLLRYSSLEEMKELVKKEKINGIMLSKYNHFAHIFSAGLQAKMREEIQAYLSEMQKHTSIEIEKMFS